MERSKDKPPLTNEERLHNAERMLDYARNNYGRPDNDLATTAALVSLAGSAFVIARLLHEQAQQGEQPMPLPDDLSGPNGDVQ